MTKAASPPSIEATVAVFIVCLARRRTQVVQRRRCFEAVERQCQQDWVTQHFVPAVLPLVRRPVSWGAPTTLSSDDFDFNLDREYACSGVNIPARALP